MEINREVQAEPGIAEEQNQYQQHFLLEEEQQQNVERISNLLLPNPRTSEIYGDNDLEI